MNDDPRHTWQTDLDRLTDTYQALLRQFDCTLSGVDRVKLETELATLDRQMSDLERHIAELILTSDF